ncbi:MAG TPA: hypothetical protein VE442_10035 [Jatrophihabitans sp.]|nr:hypothetical protein [Jatrophihabitans sp.]
MAVAVEMAFEGATLEQYEQVCGKLGYPPRGAGHPDALFHFAIGGPEGLRVVDVWTSAEAFEKFATELLGPIAAEVGVPEPKVEITPIHNYLYGPKLGK